VRRGFLRSLAPVDAGDDPLGAMRARSHTQQWVASATIACNCLCGLGSRGSSRRAGEPCLPNQVSLTRTQRILEPELTQQNTRSSRSREPQRISGPTMPSPKPPGRGSVLARNIRTMEMRRDREEVTATLEERVAEAITRFTGVIYKSICSQSTRSQSSLRWRHRSLIGWSQHGGRSGGGRAEARCRPGGGAGQD